MGAFDEIIASGGGARKAPVPSMLQQIKDLWFRNFTAPQQGVQGYSNQFFQYRRTGVPGVIESTGAGSDRGQYYDQSPAEMVRARLVSGPPTDIDTARSLVDLQNLWAQRAKERPREGYIMISPYAKDASGTYAHEAAHSLFNQLGMSATRNNALGDEAVHRGMEEPAYVSGSPENRATEAVGYAVGNPAPSGSDKSQWEFLQNVSSGGGRTGDQLKSLYRQRQSQVADYGR